jgi:hypothetical protein
MRILSAVFLMLMTWGYCAEATTILGFSEGQSCGAWTNEIRGTTKRAQLEAWVLGFLSGWGETISSAPESLVVARDPLANTTTAAVIAWMNNYCAQHPLDVLTEATRHLMDEILRRQKSN